MKTQQIKMVVNQYELTKSELRELAKICIERNKAFRINDGKEYAIQSTYLHDMLIKMGMNNIQDRFLLTYIIENDCNCLADAAGLNLVFDIMVENINNTINIKVID